MSDRAFVATEILDDAFGNRASNELLGEKVADAYDFAMDRYAEYGFPESERESFVFAQVSNVIWNSVSDHRGSTAATRRILEAWGHSGLR